MKKRLLSLILCAAMLLNIGVPVFAVDEPESGTGADTEGYKTVAEQYYGENGTATLGTLATSWEDDAQTVKAGGTVNLQISWTLAQAATYSYTSHQEPLFDTYDNTKILLTLPEGVNIIEGVSGSLQNVNDVIAPSDGSNVWTLVLNDKLDAKSSPNGMITVPLRVDGNGERAIGENLDFSVPAVLETSFTIMDRMDPANHKPSDLSYDKSITANVLSDKVTGTDDRWLIDKSEVSAVPNADKSKVTVTFELTVGLDDGTGNNAISANPATYGRPGRVPFDGNVTLTELPEVLNREGETITAESITITPEFGAKTPISVEVGSGAPVTIPLDTCEGKGIENTSVAPAAPYWSKYTVEVVYPYADFIANYYDEKQDKLNVTNDVTLTYTLKGGSAAEASDEASIEAGEVTQPAKITINKYILDISGNKTAYSKNNFASDTAVTGAATFTVTKEDGSAATIYIKTGDTYTRLASNTVTIDPNGTGDANSTTGGISIYMDPGTYLVHEESGPSNTKKMTGGVNNADDKTLTVTAAKPGTADFYDEEQLGYITVQKFGQNLGETATALEGAEFGLYKEGQVEAGKELAKATTDSSGNAHFGRLPYGTYVVKEISAPAGYVIDSTEHSVEVSEENEDVTLKVVNNSNLAPVQLQKQVFNGVRYVDVGVNYYRVFEDKFSLESSTDGENFTTVDGYGTLSLGQNGRWSGSLPAYDADGKVITYRFKEILPEGWHDPGNAGAKEMYSGEFTLTGYVGKPATEALQVIMQNDRNGSITLTKEFYRLGASGTPAKQTAQQTKFALYRQVEGSTAAAELVEESAFTGSTSFTDLERTAADKAYLYYLVEVDCPAGYAADETGTVELTVKDGDGTRTVRAWGPFDFTSPDGTAAASLSQSATVKNYAQTLPVIIKKADDVTEAFVSGAKFTIYAYDESKDDKCGDVVVTETAIGNSSGVTVWLETGKKYRVKETTVPQGYHDATESDYRTIDLTDYSSVDGDTDYKVIIKTLENHPDPKLQINKTLVGSDGKSQPLTGVGFEVYTEANGVYTRVTGYDNTTPLTIKSGTATRLPAGTYWLKEVVPGDDANRLDPSEHPELYPGKGNYDAATDSFYFGPVVVEEVKDKNNLTQTTAITNYADTGAVTVTKQAKGKDGALTALNGATIAIYKQGESEPVKTAKTANGKVTFTGLEIYDEKGDKITYVIRETAAPNGYTVSDTELTVELEAGKTVTTDTAGKDLTIVNLPEVSFQVTKVYYNTWEFRFTQKEYLMNGAQIALYQKQSDGSYAFAEMLTTDDLGSVTFNGLAQDKEYIAIEYSIPNEADFTYLEPSNGGKYLSADYPDAPPEALSAEQVKNYYYVTKAANTGNPQDVVSDKLTNVEHWAQLNILKFVREDASDPDAPDDVVDNQERVVNNAEFELYMEVLPKDTAPDAVLSFDSEHLEKYTHIGSYSSGTLYDQNGVRQDGWFATDILKVSDNVVYWLVEKTSGIGARIDPEHQITLIKRRGTQYTNDSTSLENPNKKSTQVFEYVDDRVTDRETENFPAYGGGGAMFSTVRIAKWAGAIDANGNRLTNYTPLGNATFDLYLVHEDGTTVTKLDTITTGLDNDLSGNEEDLTAWASSKAFSWDELTEKYKDGEGDIWWTDENGNGYIRVMLVETGTPAGYNAPESGYRMLMYFDKDGSKTTEVFNDAYYVKGAETEVDLAETQGTDWALYPTEETGSGEYTLLPEVTGAKQYRIVNWPVDNFAVTINKYGYTANEQTMNKTSQELDEYFMGKSGRTPLEVTMKIQRYNGTKWEDYLYPNYEGTNPTATFTTENGTFSFPQGLKVGSYRIIETVPNAGYDNIYDGTTVDGQERAYYFQVLDDNVQISMYNPAKLSLSLKKTGTDGTALANVTFTLRPKTGAGLTARTGTDGVARFAGNVGTGVYVLSESAISGHSNSYLTKYFQSAYADEKYTYDAYALKDFATTGKGIFLGYTTVVRNDQVVVTDSITLNDYGITEAELKVENPLLGSLTVLKTDKATGDAVTAPAVFKVEYKAFNTWSGEETVSDSGWSVKSSNLTTGADGKATLTNLQPGVYKITETTAPAGYDLVTTPQYVVLTGGMEKTVTITGKTVADKDAASVEVTFADPKQVSLTVEKVIESGELTVEGDHSFTFTLYNAAKEKIASQTVKVAGGAVNGTTVSAAFNGLSQGAVYYIQESNPGEDFRLKSVTGKNGLTVTPDGSYYGFTMPEGNAGATITATNAYMYAEVTILKVDGNNGTPLDNAGFGAYRKAGDDFQTNTTGKWTAKGGGTGEYTVRLPLTDLNGNTFRLEELHAPSGYVLDHSAAEVTVVPGQRVGHGSWNDSMDDAAMLAQLIFPNYPGSNIRITKYDNVRESTAAAPLSGVTFTLYSRDTDGSWKQETSAQTDKDGVVSFTVESGKVYTVTETRPAGYAGLQGLYDGNAAMTTESDGTTTYYLIDNGASLVVSKDYTYNAYNVPYVEMEIRKQDAADPNAEPAPSATVSVYEVPDNTPATLTQQQVQDLMANNTPLLSDVEVVKQGTDSTSHYTYADKTTHSDLGSKIVGGKTYLVVETDSSMPQIRDNKQVVWYVVHKVPQGATDKQIVTLKNLNAQVQPELRKSVLQGASNPSLLTQPATLRYTLTPTVNNDYPLDSFVLTDTGLTAKNGTTDLAFDEYLKDKYTVAGILVGKATHKTDNYADGDFPIQATVTFYDFNDQQIKAETVDVSQENQTVWLSSTTKAKYVTVEYSSPEFEKATGYALGQNFTPGQLIVRIVMDKQEGGEAVQAITEVTNIARIDLGYRAWSTTGVQQENPTELTRTYSAKNTFGSLETAIVSVDKDCDTGTLALDGGVATYTVTISNSSEAKASLKQAFFADLLPQGTVLNGDGGNVKLVSAPEGVTIENVRSSTRHGETVLFVFLSGELKPGEKAQVSLEVRSTNAVAAYGSGITNYVVVGSREQGVKSADNPRATSFKNSSGEWPGDLDAVLTTLQGTERLEALREILAESHFENFGYISAAKGINWSASSEATLLKTGRGDRSEDLGFTSDRLSTVNNNGYMDYQLMFSNQSNTYDYTNITFLDVLPFVGDKTISNTDRGSEWAMSFDSITAVRLLDGNAKETKLSTDQYRVFYYSDPITEANIDDVYAQVTELHYDTTALPQGWSDTKPASVTAFAVALKKDAAISLSSKDSCIIEYRLNVGQLSDEEVVDRAWSNAVNNFVCNFWKYTDAQGIDGATPAAQALSSNSVSNTVLPAPVKVGGHIWIDKDADGVWDAGESVDNFSQNQMVQRLLNGVEIRLNVYAGNNDQPVDAKTFAKGTDWTSNAEFVFDGLDSANKQDGASEEQLYSGTGGQLSMLNPLYLKGTSPSTYSILATIPSTVEVLAKPTTLGSTTGYSREPADLQSTGAHAGEAKDNNYQDASATGSALNSVSERFYLHASTDNLYDNTKDLGVVLYRNVTISKVAADDGITPVPGAEFKVYGPFASVEEANTAALDESNLVGTYTTDTQGQASLGELNWFQAYVIVETKTGAGFRLDGARASNDQNVISNYTGSGTTNPAWVLGIPEDTVTAVNQEVEVTNTRTVQYHLEASKTLTGKALTDGMFQFELLDQSQQVIETKANVGGTVTFGNITANAVGTVTYYIREKIPAEAVNNQYKGYTYDSRMYKAEVTVGENSTNHNLTASVAYFVQDQDGNWVAAANGAAFENSYAAAPTEYTPSVEKTFAAGSETPVEGDSFTFELALTGGNQDEVVMPAKTTVTVEGAGKADFGAIRFLKEGTYTFAITEKADPTLEGFGYEFDKTKWTLTVVTKDVDGAITVQSHKYTAAGQTDSDDQATFVNNYDPQFAVYAPVVRKQITGDTPDGKQTFHFSMTLMTQNPVNAVFMPEKTEISVEGAGIGTFGEIRFRSAGIYTFTIVEKQETVKGYTYDARTWTLTVKVAQKLFSKELEVASVEYLATDGTKRSDAAEFINEYRKERFPEDSHPPEEGGSTPPTPVVTIPQTEDSFPLTAVAVALVVSLAALIAIPIIRKRRGKK